MKLIIIAVVTVILLAIGTFLAVAIAFFCALCMIIEGLEDDRRRKAKNKRIQ